MDRNDIGRRVVKQNNFGVKKVVYFDQRYVCILRDTIEIGQRRSSQLVDVVDLETQKLVFQEMSSEIQIITHVEVFKIAKTGETQLFVGTTNQSPEGHSRAEWKIYRIIRRKDAQNQ